MTTILQGKGDLIEIDPNGPVRIIGERINPSGRSRLRQALLDTMQKALRLVGA
jgi:cobalamin-dependent methionine synthase I